MDLVLDFIKKNKNIKGIIFNGNSLTDFIKSLRPNTVIDKTVDIKGNCRVHKVQLFTLDGIKCIQHNYSSNYNGFSHKDRKKIAEEFLKYLNESN